LSLSFARHTNLLQRISELMVYERKKKEKETKKLVVPKHLAWIV
jgi:hypothetical protein